MQDQKAVQKKFSIAIQEDGYKKLVNNTLGDPKKAAKFIAAISSAVAVNPALQDCTPASILSGGLVGEALNLSPSPQLGHYYLVPFDTKNGKQAQFIIGYKGYIQLAIRSGEYRNINVVAIKEGELVRYDFLTETLDANMITDPIKRLKAKTIGYYGYLELMNGFKKTLYWTKEQMENHALKYSKGYAAKKGYTFWEKDFDQMAFKTILRQLISKWGIMSIEMQRAYTTDMGVVREDGGVDYVDNEEDLGANQETIIQDEPEEVDAEIVEGEETPSDTKKVDINVL